MTDQATSGSRFRALLFGTSPSAAGPLLRLTLAAVMFPHGLQKTFGAFGGYGWSGTMGFFTKTVGLPTPVAALAILIEFLGPIALVVGFGTRAVALGFLAIMTGAIVTTHAQYGFFMNWFGAQKGEGFEYHLLVIGIALALLVGGAGCCSLDRQIGGATSSKGLR
jgi:putative oxidoreductase